MNPLTSLLEAWEWSSGCFCLPSKWRILITLNSWRKMWEKKCFLPLLFFYFLLVCFCVCPTVFWLTRQTASRVLARAAASGGIGLSGGIKRRLSGSAAAPLLIISAGEENWLLNGVRVSPGFRDVLSKQPESALGRRHALPLLILRVIWDDARSVMQQDCFSFALLVSLFVKKIEAAGGTGSSVHYLFWY